MIVDLTVSRIITSSFSSIGLCKVRCDVKQNCKRLQGSCSALQINMKIDIAY